MPISLTWSSCECSAVVESEEVVVAVVASRATNNEVESLGKLHGLFGVAIDDEVSTDKRDDAIIDSWLSIEGNNLVLDAGHASQLDHYGLHSQELFSLVGKHRHVGVKSLERSAVRVKRVVVVLDKLFAHFFQCVIGIHVDTKAHA